MHTQHIGRVSGNARAIAIQVRYFRDALQERLRPGLDLRETGVVISIALMHLLKVEWRKKSSIQARSIAGSTAHVARTIVEVCKGTQMLTPWTGEQPTDFLPVMAMLWLTAHQAEHGVSVRVKLESLLPGAIEMAITKDEEMFRLMMRDTLHGIGDLAPMGGGFTVTIGHGPGGSDD
ncbi:MAG: hypothetical protein MH825_08340 [Cyanobacteria bacterium]|nr:hypothetical protein [Cyanobacteriota bacterium]